MAKSNLTEGAHMRRNNKCGILFLVSLLLLHTSIARAQDEVPHLSQPAVQSVFSKPLPVFKQTPDTIEIRNLIPATFKQTTPNIILDENHVLDPILARLFVLRQSGEGSDTLRIVHIGDSHVRGRIYPQTVGEKLTEAFGAIIYTDMGVNGATCLTFTHPARIQAIADLQPDLLIVSFGTNESHNRRYNSTVHYHQMSELITLIRAKIDSVPILMTTPPGSYDSFRQSRRKRTYSINPRTAVAVQTIKRFADSSNIAVWDMYTILGGSTQACKNWWGAGLMRPDHVHYLPEAYALQGELLFEALINAYNDYVIH